MRNNDDSNKPQSDPKPSDKPERPVETDPELQDYIQAGEKPDRETKQEQE